MTRILIAEDSPTQAEKLRWILENEGFEVDVAVDAQDGLARFASRTPDMVISDILMPGMTGYEFCHRIKQDPGAYNVPVILLSTLNDPMDIIRGLECEADNFITKPYEAEQLVSRIRTVLQNRENRGHDKLSVGVEIIFLGKKFVISSAKEQILDLLIATFEDIVRTNRELKRKEAELATAKLKLEAYAQQLERRVQERTVELLDKQHQLHHAQKMEAMGQLTGGLAHDFNNMLTVVIGNLDALVARDGDLKNKKLVEAALEAACRGAELTQQLLAFSRKQQLAPQLSDVNDLAGGMVKLLARTLGENIEIAFEPAPDLWPVVIDPAQTRSAIANLATNARDAMPNGGKLRVETRNVALDAEQAAVNDGMAAGEYVLLAVSDSGAGMSAATLARVFEPFFTTKPEGKGTGLGLSMVFGFIQQSGGHVRIASEMGKGTVVKIYLPRSAAETATAAVSRPPAESTMPYTACDETILVVEDNPGVRETVIRQLNALGYQVIEASGAAAALAVLQRQQPIDLLFTDIIMPGGKSGHDLAREARSLRPALPILFTSGYRGEQAEGDQIDPQSMFLGKPYRARELAQKVREALDRKLATQ